MAELARPAKNISTMRRLPEAANDTEVAKQVESQTDAITNIADSLASLQPANDEDYNREAKQRALEQIRATEQQIILQSQQSQKLDYLQEIAFNTDDISAKLSILSDRLKEKYQAANDAVQETPAVAEPTTSSALSDMAQPAATTETTEPPRLIESERQPSRDLMEDSGDVKGAPTTVQAKLIGAVVGVGTAVKTGFQKSVSVADKISGMLFKFTVSQAVGAAKMAIALAAIVLGIDILKAVWAAWGEKIMAKFDEWSAKLGEWWDGFKDWAGYFTDFKDAFDGMQGSLMAIQNAWESGDWPALAVSIGGAFMDGIKLLSGIIDRLTTKLLAGILDTLGFKEAAKAVEAEGLQRYSNQTNNPLNEENQAKLAQEQLRRQQNDGLTPSQRGVTSFLPDSFRKMIGALNEHETAQIDAEKKDWTVRQSLSQEDQVKVIAAGNEAKKALARARDVAENANPDNKAQVAKVDKYKKEALDYINNPALDKSPAVKAELQKQLSELAKPGDAKANVKPATSAESKDAQSAKNIQIAEANKTKAAPPLNQNTANVLTNIVKNNKSFNIQAPITNTHAPGVYRATGVN